LNGIDLEAFLLWETYVDREDEYSFYRSFAPEYLRRAKESWELLEHYRVVDHNLRMPLARDAIITYTVPFGKNRGRAGGAFRLNETFVPDHLRDLHKRILARRHTILAHCDFGPRNPQVAPIGVLFRGAGLGWENYRDLVPEFTHLIDAVLANTNAYLAEKGWTSPELAFQDIPEPPSAAHEDPGQPPQQKAQEEPRLDNT
jgi:hypothetical protein